MEMKTAYVERSGLRVAETLVRFVEEEVLPALERAPEQVWAELRKLLDELAPRNRALLERRADLQARIDDWHRRGTPHDAAAYEAFLREIGYLEPSVSPFSIETGPVDAEVSDLAGPQLIVPARNPRFCLNAANARWGSLYDAFYGTDALDAPPAATGGYDPDRGVAVVARVRDFLTETLPGWEAALDGGGHEALVGRAERHGTRSYLFRHNGLHIEIRVDRETIVGAADPLGISDVVVEAALTTIIDLEDAVAAVSAEEKVEGYATWLGLLRGDLAAAFDKDGQAVVRTLQHDRRFLATTGEISTLPGRSLLFVRNVGLLMTSPMVLLADGEQAPEGVLDAFFTTLCALHDLRGLGRHRNSRAGSIYVVKPKLHGSEEAGFANLTFDLVEDGLGLARNTVKVGLMDEERRTSVNLANCIHALRGRIVFTNTGFLDRTGDEIRTSTYAGAMLPKKAIAGTGWFSAYERRNVQIALACGFSGRAQIGKGMWAMPDEMAAMLEQKVAHPRTGANTAWVPSPTAATLHALHYHLVDPFAVRGLLRAESPAETSELLRPPLLGDVELDDAVITREIENNVQGILGYVVRWIDQGIGCSKVPDISDTALMEDRATLRISSQHLANWLLHGVCSREVVEEALMRMARKVDEQNALDPAYRPMASDPSASIALAAARALIFDGLHQPNGYTEPLLHEHRRRVLVAQASGPSPRAAA